ncbi:hypothetical protein HUJ04_006627 [Dendroctonus ponderosae]|nr:hypothetical protein HUJ04_006627 [Dendroctonus ponderosae]
MERIHYGLVLFRQYFHVKGQYNYPTPATPFNGGPAPQQTSSGNFPQQSSTGATGYPSSGTLNSNNYQNLGGSPQRPALARPPGQPNEYPQRPQSGDIPSVKPTGTGYPPAGAPSGPAIPEGPSKGQQSVFPPLSISNSGPTGNIPANGPKPEHFPSAHGGYPSASKPSGSNFPVQNRPAANPSNVPQEQGGFSRQPGGFGNQGINPSGYPGQGQGSGYTDASQSSYPGAQRPQSPASGSFAGQNGRPETPQGAFGAGAGAASLDQSSGDTTGEHGIAGPSEVNEGDYSAIPGEPDADYPIFSFVPQTSFSCDQQRYPGYYADVEARCQVFHVCANNKTYDFLCPNGTIFHQQFFVCVWWNQFDCNTAQSLYEMNANIYDHAISGAQQQTGGIPAGSGADGYGGGFVGTQPPNINQQVSEGSQIPSAPVGADGFQTPGYQPTGPGALPSVSSQQTQTNSYPSQEPLASGGNGGYPSGGPSRPQDFQKEGVSQNGPQASPQAPHRPSTSPQVPNYPSSGQHYPNNRPHGTFSHSTGFGGPSTFAGDTQNAFPSSTAPGRYQGSSKPTQGSQYLPPIQPQEALQSGTYSGPQKPISSSVNTNGNSSGYSGNQQTNPSSNSQRGTNGGYPGEQPEPSQAYPGSQQPISGYRGQQTNAGYPNSSGAYPSNQRQQGELQTSGVNSKGEQPREGHTTAQSAGSFPSGGGASGVYSGNQQVGGTYSSTQQSSPSSPSTTYPNEQQSNGGYSNTRKPGGYQTRGYLPPVGK